MESSDSLINEDEIISYLYSECQIVSQRIASLLSNGPKIKSTHPHSASASLANCNEIFKKEQNDGQFREKMLKDRISLLDQLKRIDEDILAAKSKYNTFQTEFSRLKKEIKEVLNCISEKNDFIRVLEESHHSQLYGKVNKTDFT